MSAQEGMTFTEFTYQLLQGYDFYELYRALGCTIQVGGSDQWGNILCGLELINKTQPGEAPLVETTKNKGFALTTPLLTNSSGQKFGKSAGNAVWLDENLTSHLDFYQVIFFLHLSFKDTTCQFTWQFFMKTTDADVGRYLKMFTLLPLEEILSIMQDHESHPERRIAQRTLAEEVTLMVYGGRL